MRFLSRPTSLPGTAAEAPLARLLAGCRRADRAQQQQLYLKYYSYALSVCQRYTRQRDEAEEAVNDGFMKVFQTLECFDLERYNLEASFRGWLKKIMICTAIDAFRASNKHHQATDLADLPYELTAVDHTPLDALAYDDLLALVQQLPPAYRTVFNLFAIDGYSHEEIAQQLGISTGTSKSNLFRARGHLQGALTQLLRPAYAA